MNPSTGPQRRRTEAREQALTLLYEAEAKALTGRELVATLPVSPQEFTNDLVLGVSEHVDEIDGLIERFAEGWHVARLSAVDRAILRLAVYELRHRPDVPTAVVLDEAVELAKRYSTEDSGRFVNGVLAAIAGDVRDG